MNINKKSFSIYKITCTINNKVYIGQTSGTLKHRFYQHVNKESGCIKLKRAIEKYGKENFTIEEIDIASDKETALQKEAHYIKQYKSNNIKYGYNILANGYSSYSTKKVYCIETKETFETVLLAAKVMNVCPSFMAAVCRGNKSTVRGLHFTYINKKGDPIINTVKFIKPNKTKIRCIELNMIFESVAKAARYIGRTSMTIFNCLNGKSPRAGGYHWEYVDTKWHRQVKYTKSSRSRKIICTDTNKIFNSATEAARSINVSLNSILSCCNGISKTSGGYHWNYLDGIKKVLPPKNRNGNYSSKKQPVKCVETNKIYESISQASREFGIAKNSIQMALWYPNRTVKGYHFTYCYDIEREPYNAKKIICVETGKVFNSLIDASRVICKDSSALSVALKKPHRTCGGFHWKYL